MKNLFLSLYIYIYRHRVERTYAREGKLFDKCRILRFERSAAEECQFSFYTKGDGGRDVACLERVTVNKHGGHILYINILYDT